MKYFFEENFLEFPGCLNKAFKTEQNRDVYLYSNIVNMK